MDWNKGYTSSWSLMKVNPETWEDDEAVTGLVSASITKDGDSLLFEDGSIQTTNEQIRGYVRLYLIADGYGGGATEAISTLLVTKSTRTVNDMLVGYTADCSSVLKPAADRLLPVGWHCGRGTDPISKAAELLSSSIKAPVRMAVSDYVTLCTYTAEKGETALSMAWALLEGTGYEIMVDGRGVVTIEQPSGNVAATFDLDVNDVVVPEITEDDDIYDVPNVVMAVRGAEFAIVKNDDEQSPTSIKNVGWEKWHRVEVTANDGSSLMSVANQTLEAMSESTMTRSYQREYEPGVGIHSTVELSLSNGVDGLCKVSTQQIEAGFGALVSETVKTSSKNWRA